MRKAALVAAAVLAAATGLAAEPAVDPKIRELETILASRNDNDPRLDLDFNELTPAVKKLFRAEYKGIAREKRNERGTIVYLLGRNLKTAEDWKFLRAVALEPPCLSLSNCDKKPAPGSDEEASGDEVTLAYPSLVALRQARAELEKPRAAGAGLAPTKEALGLFAAAKKSKTRAVARMAATSEKKFARP